jgi:hypothetical protein
MLNYQALGSNDEMRHRRLTVLRFMLKGAEPPEIAHQMGKPVKTVYNDIAHLKKTQIYGEESIEIIRDQGNSFYEQKIRELEGQIARLPNRTPEDILKFGNIRLGLEKQILACKEKSLQLAGAFQETVNHGGQIDLVFEEVDGGARTDQEEGDPFST